MSRENVDWSAPIPLGYRAAVDKALEFRLQHKLSYPAISVVMGHYHGFQRYPGWWQEELHKAGAPNVRDPKDAKRAQRARQAQMRRLRVAA